jgi:hypothetical protein
MTKASMQSSLPPWTTILCQIRIGSSFSKNIIDLISLDVSMARNKKQTGRHNMHQIMQEPSATAQGIVEEHFNHTFRPQ